jgi:predicted ATPase
LIEAAEGLGEPPDDPLLLFSVLYGFWVGNRMAFKGDTACELAAQFHALAQGQNAATPRMIGHMLMGITLVLVGQPAEGKSHLDRVIELYDPSAHRVLATRFGHDVRMTAFCWRALAGWMLGHADAATLDVEHALRDARETGHASTSMFALCHAALARILLRDTVGAATLADEAVVMAEEKGSLYWKSYGLLLRGCVLAENGKASDAANLIVSAITAMRSTGATAYRPWYMAVLAEVHAALGEFDEARRCIAEALAITGETGERWYESEIHRIAGEISLATAGADPELARAHFRQAIAIARTQQAKSFELRAAASLARMCSSRGSGSRQT